MNARMDMAIPLAVLLSAATLTGLLVASGEDVGGAWRAFLAGSLTTRAGLAETAVYATPLLLCGLSVALSFRAGLFNIGAEGQLLAGMLLCAAVGIRDPWMGPVLPLLIGALAGAALAGIAAFLRFARDVPEVIATLLLNFVALYLVGFAVHGFLKEAAGALPQSDPIAASAALPRVLSRTRLHAGTVVALVAALAVHAALFHTRFGLRVRAFGASPRAARIAGFPVTRDAVLAFCASGFLAGLAGAVEVAGVTRRLFEDPSSGMGYLAIAVALLGRLNPARIVFAAAFFAALESGGGGMERHAGLTMGFTRVAQAVAVLAFLVADRDRVLGWMGGASRRRM